VHSVDNPNEKDIRIVLAFVATHPDLRLRKHLPPQAVSDHSEF
jgi:hypothetical protein